MKISIDRVMEKLDAYFAKNDSKGAEKHLHYWLAESKAVGDTRALFCVLNELIGFYRKQQNAEKALEYCAELQELIVQTETDGTVGAATAYVNIATAYKAFGKSREAVSIFEQAKAVYEAHLEPNDPLLAGLYNNMGLALCDVKRFSQAKALYRQALAVLEKGEADSIDAAVTYLNLADAAEREEGAETAQAEIEENLELAKAVLEKQKESTDGYYAFVCEKCAPTFGYYGYFVYQHTLEERAKRIYEGH